MKSGIRILHVRVRFDTIERRTAFHFAKGAMTQNLVASVELTAADPAGREVVGQGGIHLAGPWAFPSKAVPREQKLEAMRRTLLALADQVVDARGVLHPLDLYWARREAILDAARRVSEEMRLAEPLPALAAYVSYAAIDMAALDALGIACGANTYALLAAEHLGHDLGYYLGDEFKGKYPGNFLSSAPRPTTAFAHTVGETDPLTAAELKGDEPDDGLPVTLEDWIRRDGVRFLKVKLAADDLVAAVRRTADIAALAPHAELSVDFNEACEDPAWLVEYLEALRGAHPAAFEALLYVEQPFSRDACVSPADVARVQALKPLVADESLTDAASARAALDAGWAGLALKVGKVMSSAFLHVALARRAGRLITVQDLCNVGLAHLASIGLAARVPLTGGAECNGRQFAPHAFPDVRRRRPGAFRFHDGVCDTAALDGPGLGF